MGWRLGNGSWPSSLGDSHCPSLDDSGDVTLGVCDGGRPNPGQHFAVETKGTAVRLPLHKGVVARLPPSPPFGRLLLRGRPLCCLLCTCWETIIVALKRVGDGDVARTV
ncbi:UNVERIFIED_CONTAM: hypothetical protein Sindi_0385600 [Sesamum indicum]